MTEKKSNKNIHPTKVEHSNTDDKPHKKKKTGSHKKASSSSTTKHDHKKKKTATLSPREDPPAWHDISLIENVRFANGDIEVGVKPLSRETSSIGLDAKEDPFARRDGKTLLWRNVNMILVSFSYQQRL